MKKFAILLPLALLAACGEEPAPEPTQAAAPAEPIHNVPAPDQALFTQVFAATCPDAEPVSRAICQRPMGDENAYCDFGVGEDEAMRHEATLEIDESGENWQLADAEALCAEHDSHHVEN